MDASILKKPFFPSQALVKSNLYFRLQNLPKAIECLKSVSKDSLEYAECANLQGAYYQLKGENEEAVKYYETALKYSKDCQEPPDVLMSILCNLANSLLQSKQYKKAVDKLTETKKLHDEIYGKRCESKILSHFMVDVGILFYELDDMESAIGTLKEVEKMQKRITRCNDTDLILVNLYMAKSCRKLRQNEKSLNHSLKYLHKALRLGHKIFGEHNLSSELLKMYQDAAVVYSNCGRYHEASLMLERCSKLTESLFGDNPHPGKIVEIADKWQ